MCSPKTCLLDSNSETDKFYCYLKICLLGAILPATTSSFCSSAKEIIYHDVVFSVFFENHLNIRGLPAESVLCGISPLRIFILILFVDFINGKDRDRGNVFLQLLAPQMPTIAAATSQW